MKVKSESEVVQSFMTLRDPMGCSPPGPSVHGIFQARVLEWDAIAFSSLITHIPSVSEPLLPPNTCATDKIFELLYNEVECYSEGRDQKASKRE